MSSSITVDEGALEQFRRRVTVGAMGAVQVPAHPPRKHTLTTTVFGTPRTCEACCQREKQGHSEPCAPCGERLRQRAALSRRLRVRQAASESRRRLLVLLLASVACASTAVSLAAAGLL